MGFWFVNFQRLGGVGEPIGGLRGFLPCRTGTGGLGDLVLVVAWLGQFLFGGSLLLAGTARRLLGLGVLFLGGSLVLAVPSWCPLGGVVSVEAHPMGGSSAPTVIQVSWHRRGPCAREGWGVSGEFASRSRRCSRRGS